MAEFLDRLAREIAESSESDGITVRNELARLQRLVHALDVIESMKRPSIERLLVVRGYKVEAQAITELVQAWQWTKSKS